MSDTLEEAVARWNTRASLPDVSAQGTAEPVGWLRIWDEREISPDFYREKPTTDIPRTKVVAVYTAPPAPHAALREEDVERIAGLVWDHLCPGIRQTDADNAWYRQAVRIVLHAVALQPKAPAPETIKPHIYMPDYQAMGDCRVCGHGQDAAWHRSGQNSCAEWQSIETAPKDGSKILLKFEGPFHDALETGVTVGCWLDPAGGGRWWLSCIWAASSHHREPIAWAPIPSWRSTPGVSCDKESSNG